MISDAFACQVDGLLTSAMQVELILLAIFVCTAFW